MTSPSTPQASSTIQISDCRRAPAAVHVASRRTSRVLTCCSLLACLLAAPTLTRADGPPKATAPCDTAKQLCVTGDGKATFEPDKSINFDALAKEDKKFAKKAPVTVRIEVLDGRASLFVDGRWMGLAGTEMSLRPGRHVITLQDKSRVLARGVLTIKDRSPPIELELRHPDGDASNDSALDDL